MLVEESPDMIWHCASRLPFESIWNEVFFHKGATSLLELQVSVFEVRRGKREIRRVAEGNIGAGHDDESSPLSARDGYNNFSGVAAEIEEKA